MVRPVSSRAPHSDMSRKLSMEEAGAEDRVRVTGMEEIIGQPDIIRGYVEPGLKISK